MNMVLNIDLRLDESILQTHIHRNILTQRKIYFVRVFRQLSRLFVLQSTSLNNKFPCVANAFCPRTEIFRGHLAKTVGLL